MRKSLGGAFLVAQMIKKWPATQEPQVWSMVWEDLLEKGIPTPVFLPGGFHGQRNLAGYSPWGRKESDITERLSLTNICWGGAFSAYYVAILICFLKRILSTDDLSHLGRVLKDRTNEAHQYIHKEISKEIPGAGEDSWESLGQRGDQTSGSSRKSTLNTHWKDWCWNWNSNTLATWCEDPAHWERPWCRKILKAGGQRDDRGWDG